MTAPLIAPLIPPRARPGAREPAKTATARRLPVAAAPEVPAVPDDVVYGTGRIDESGRVADRAMTGALGWQPGDRLTFTAAAGVVIARRDPAGMVTMPAKPYLVIPAALRRRCGLRAGSAPAGRRHARRVLPGSGQHRCRSHRARRKSCERGQVT
jgi:hypothetical protein